MPVLFLRGAAEADTDLLWSMLYEAAFWGSPNDRPPREEALADPDLRIYLEDWGRDGDRALIGWHGDEPLGAGWYRLFSDDRHGYGFVEATIPELSLGVVPRHRRQGIARMLLSALLVQARLDGHLAVSLSVERDNPARTLYEQLGFEPMDSASGAETMVNRFALR